MLQPKKRMPWHVSRKTYAITTFIYFTIAPLGMLSGTVASVS